MRVAAIVLGLVVVSTPSQASRSCMTRAEARQQFATSHLYWYGRGHCWHAMTPSRHVVHRVRVVFNGIAWADHSHVLKPGNRSQDSELVQREAQRDPAEPNNPEPEWREAMSEMLTVNETPSPSVNWENRWVEIAQVPLGGDTVALEDAVANAAHRIERMFTPMSVLLAFLASLGLTLALIETLLFRRANRLRVAVLRSQCAFASSAL